MTATEILVDTGDYGSVGNGYGAHDEELTFVECAAPDCHNMAFQAAPGSGKRSSRYCRQPDCTRTTARPKPTEDDPFSSPLTAAERRLAKQLELPLRLAGMGVYRANVVDGLIIGHHAQAIAEALVLESRVSKTVKQMCEAVAKFAGAGPVALVLFDMGLQIAANHKVPIIGDVKPVDADVRLEEQRIMQSRQQRKEGAAKPASVAQEVHESVRLQTPVVTCEVCGRKVLRNTAGEPTECMCGNTIYA